MIEIEGIVLTELKYGETSKIINILTPDLGIIGIYAKGACTLKSKTRPSTNKLVHSKFKINYKKDKLSNLLEAEVINEFTTLRNDILKISYGNILLDLTNQTAKENTNGMFENLLNALLCIDKGLNPEAITQIVMLKYLDNLGIAPYLDGCVECGSKEDIITISSDKGGYVCKNCIDKYNFVSNKALKLIKMYYLLDLKKLDKLEIKNDLSKEIDMFIEDYYQRYSGIYLKSKEFLKLVK